VPRKGKTWRPPSQSRGKQSRAAQSGASQPRDTQARVGAETSIETRLPEGPIEDQGGGRAPADAAERERPAERAEAVRPNRQARKEEARRQRELLRRKAARRRLWGRVMGIAGAVVVVAGVVLGVVLFGGGGKTQVPQDLPGIQKDTEPWPPELTHLQQRLRQIGIGFLGQEQLAYHIHQHLDVYVNGSQVPVPANIGIISGTGLAFIHAHDTSGVIHVESPTVHKYTLGNFFDVWGVLFTKDCLGAYCNQGDDKVRVFVGGEPVTGNPRNVVLRNYDEIVVTYGTPQQLPKPIPKSYAPLEEAKKEAQQARKKAEASPTPSASSATPSPASS
jgi:hypothetical protein